MPATACDQGLGAYYLGLGAGAFYPRARALRRADRARAACARLPDREALDDAGSVPAVAQRAAPGLQPVDQPRPRHRLRRGHRARRRPAPVPLRAGPAGQRSRLPRDQVPPPRRGGARARPRAAGDPVRAAAAGPADAGRAQGAQRADGHAGARWPTSSGAGRARRARLRGALARRPGQKEDRFEQLLGRRGTEATGATLATAPGAPPAAPPARRDPAPGGLEARVAGAGVGATRRCAPSSGATRASCRALRWAAPVRSGRSRRRRSRRRASSPVRPTTRSAASPATWPRRRGSARPARRSPRPRSPGCRS